MKSLDELRTKYEYQMDWPVKGCEPLKIEVAEENLLWIKRIFDRFDIKFWLVFGTALGAYRDFRFIPYDYDTDIAIFDTDIPKLFKATKALLAVKFTLSRITGPLLSYAYNGEYVDVYVFSDNEGMYRCDKYRAKYEEFDNLRYTTKLMEEPFLIPSNTAQYLEDRYGKEWQKPIRNRPTKF